MASSDVAPRYPSPPQPVAAGASQAITGLFVAVVIVLALYFGQDLLVPLALAMLLSFALAPLVVRLMRVGLPKIPSVIVVVAIAAGVVGGIALVVADQFFELANNLPRYEQTLKDKIHAVKESSADDGVLSKAVDTLRSLNNELDSSTPAEGVAIGKTNASGEIAVAKPVPVAVQDTAATSPLETLVEILGPVVGPMATAGIVVVFAIFILLQREDLRDRAIRLFAGGDMTRATKAMDDAASRVSRYLLMQLIVNVCYGLPTALGLWLIGVPNPLLWGLMAAVLRFIPFIGGIIAAFFPLVLSIAVDPGWSMFLLTLALMLGLELVTSNVLEPWLFGSSTGLSPVAIVVAAVFWTALWGPVGLLLATPLTVCVVVLGRHVPQLNFLDILLGDRPVLTLDARIYQRLLANNSHEALELAETAFDETGLDKFADDVLVPVLRQADEDRTRGSLTSENQRSIAVGMDEIMDYLIESETEEDDAAETPDAARVLCIGARNDLDTTMAHLLGRLLERRGARVIVLGHTSITPRNLARLSRAGMRAACLVAAGPASKQHGDRLARRLRTAFGADMPVIVVGADPSVAAATPSGSAKPTGTTTGALAAAVEAVTPLLDGTAKAAA